MTVGTGGGLDWQRRTELLERWLSPSEGILDLLLQATLNLEGKRPEHWLLVSLGAVALLWVVMLQQLELRLERWNVHCGEIPGGPSMVAGELLLAGMF